MSSRESACGPDQVFHLFPLLPPELREEIWRYCLPHRVCELDIPETSSLFWDKRLVEITEAGELIFPPLLDDPPPCRLYHTLKNNARPPMIAQVCHESRFIAFKEGNYCDPDVEQIPDEAQVWTQSFAKHFWEDKTRDSVHLFWTPLSELDFEWTGNPLHYLAWQKGQFASGNASFLFEYIDPEYDRPLEYNQPMSIDGKIWPYNFSTTRNLTPLKQTSSEWQVVMRVVVIHTKFRHAAKTGLFGLLGDERVQITDISEEAKLHALLDFAEACAHGGPIITDREFDRRCLDTLRHDLEDAICNTFGSLDRAGRMRPAIMFRLCTQMCGGEKDQVACNSRS